MVLPEPRETPFAVPRYYNFLYAFELVSYITNSVFVGPVIAYYSLHFIQFIYQGDSVIFLPASDLEGLYIFIMFFSIIANAVFLNYLNSKFPDFQRFANIQNEVYIGAKGSVNQVKDRSGWAFKNIDNVKLSDYVKKQAIGSVILMGIIFSVFFTLYTDSYYKFTKNTFVVNDFFSTHETIYTFAQIKMINISCTPVHETLLIKVETSDSKIWEYESERPFSKNKCEGGIDTSDVKSRLESLGLNVSTESDF